MSTLLEVQNLTKRFQGLVAVNDLSFKVEEGTITGLIGPNGAGKTTVFNLITGFYPPTDGKVFFKGKDITGFKPEDCAKLGILRTFQVVKPFAELTVLDNVMVGAFKNTANVEEARAVALETLEFLGLMHLLTKQASALTISARKSLEIARALAAKPVIMLLDEPFGGMLPTEVDHMIDLLRRLRGNGITILIIEHVLRAVMNLSDHITVIQQGTWIGQGTPTEVANNPVVIQAYLGVKNNA